MKRIIYSIFIFALIFSVIVPTSIFANSGVKIEVNGEIISFENEPIIKNGRTLVQAKAFFEKIGASVSIDKEKNIIYIENKYTTIELTIDNNVALIHRKYDFSGIPEKVELDVVAQNINNNTYVPLRFVAETLDSKVDWIGKSNTVVITTKDYNPELDASLLKNPLKYNIIDVKTVRMNEELGTWYSKYSTIEGIHSKKINETTYIIVSYGEKNTGGYSISIDGIYDIGEGKGYVDATLITPQPDDIVIQMITYPNALISLEGDANIEYFSGYIKEKSIESINSIDYTIIKPESFKDNNELSNWYEANFKKQGVHYIKENNDMYILVSGGEVRTGGYKINISSINKTRPDEVSIIAELVKPSKDMVVIQVISYPSVIIKIDGTTIKSVQGNIIK